MPQKDEVEFAERKVLEDIAALAHRLGARSIDLDDWFRNLLYGILKCSLADYDSVQNGVNRSMYEAAWGRRNLAELSVITKYVLASRINATEFKHQLRHDSCQFYEALARLQEITREAVRVGLAELAAQPGPMQQKFEEVLKEHIARGPQSEQIYAEAASHRQALKGLGLDATPFKRTRQMAADQGEASKDKLEALNTICSKILHRTSLSIASATRKDSLAELGPGLSASSFTDVLLIYDAIKKHVDQYGFHPPD
jgi:hypothetical protein